ncbi:MAG: class I SAM-dependent methyltransferase [bacterium]|nr:class I SAM-dependent methyltransferase [bacterium]
MDVKNELYNKYVSLHSSHSQSGVPKSKDDIIKESTFKVFDKWYGDFIPENKNSKIIDIACGYGNILLWLKEKGYSDVVGLDISPEQVDLAKKLGVNNIIKADFRDYLKDKAVLYDVVFAVNIIEHFNKYDVFEIIKILYEALKPGGSLIISTVNAESMFFGRHLYGDLTHEHAWTSSTLKTLLEFTGFKNIVIKEAAPIVTGIRSFFRYIAWKILSSLIRFYIFVETYERNVVTTQGIIACAIK